MAETIGADLDFIFIVELRESGKASHEASTVAHSSRG